MYPGQPTPIPPKLKPSQVDHFNRIIDILHRFYYYVDGSEAGTGKTHVTSAVSIALKLPVIIICPVNAISVWEQAMAMYNLPRFNLPDVGAVMTYDIFAGRKGSQPKHGLLYRSDEDKKPAYFPTPLLARVCQTGVLFVMDEAQKLKNDNNAHKAIKTFIQYLYSIGGGKSRLAMLSGTFLDKEEQVTDFCRMVGFITERTLYNGRRGDYHLTGAGELQTWAKRIDPIKAEQFIQTEVFTPSSVGAKQYVFDMFVKVIRPRILSIMPKVIDIGSDGKPVATFDIKNGFYVMTPQEAEAYRAATYELRNSVRVNRAGEAVIEQNSMGAVTKALTKLQMAKANIMIRQLIKDLQATYEFEGQKRYYKVIAFADYYDVIDLIRNVFSQFNVLTLTGKTDQPTRARNIELFNQDNDNYRIMVANPVAGGVSVNLQDLTGRRARIMYLMPGYRINELHQASLRTYRAGTIGIAKVRFVYGLAEGASEASILNALYRKGRIMHKILEEQNAKFPDEYENEFEEDPIKLFGPDFFERNPDLLPKKGQEIDVGGITEDLAALIVSEPNEQPSFPGMPFVSAAAGPSSQRQPTTYQPMPRGF